VNQVVVTAGGLVLLLESQGLQAYFVAAEHLAI
jgi:hypothetical protein